MNKTIFTIGLFSILALIITQQQTYAIYEDQSFICKQNHHLENQLSKTLSCTLVNDDNVFTDKGKQIIDNQIYNQLDVFSPQYLYELD